MFSTISKSISIISLSALFLSACSSDNNTNNGVVIDVDQGGKIDTSSDVDVKKMTDANDDTSTTTDSGLADVSADVAVDVGPDPDPDKLRMATWNIFKLDEPGQGDAARVPEDYERLAGYVDKLEADLIALQEMNGEAGVRTLFPASIWDVECEERNSNLNVCVVLRKSKQWTIERHPDVVSLQAGSGNLRSGLDFTISKAGFPSVRILAVHMKANCLSGMADSACPTFFTQITALEEWIDERAATDEPFLVLGDFNRFMTDDDPAWMEIDDGTPSRAMLTRSIAPDDTDCWFPTFVDHIVLDNITSTWLQGSAQQGYDELNLDFDVWSEKLSDHCPLWADFTFPSTL